MAQEDPRQIRRRSPSPRSDEGSTLAHSSPQPSTAYPARDAKVDRKFLEIDQHLKTLRDLAPPKDDDLGFTIEPPFKAQNSIRTIAKTL